MHEMSIAMNVIELVSDRAQADGAAKISQIDMEIGDLAGVMVDSIEFCFDVACQGTMAEGAQLKIIPVAGIGKCLECHEKFQLDDFFIPCPECNGYRIEVLQGRELRVKSIIVD